MAYIYEFAFLCDSLIDANRIMYYLGEETWPGLGGVACKIGDIDCFVTVQPHDLVSGEKTGKSLWWVSVIPYYPDVKTGSVRWPSGGVPKKDKSKKDYFDARFKVTIKAWPRRLKFLYACAGVEVTGFGDDEHILSLVKNKVPLKGAFISTDLWEKAGEPENWICLNPYSLSYFKL